jgi:GNAT superfamily N-acetyltransferase
MGITLRLATSTDVPKILEIVKANLPLMRLAGNPQWDETYPLAQHFEADVELQQLWVAFDEERGEVVGCGALTESPEPDYAQAGCDLSLKSIVPHRMAIDPRCQRKGIATLFLRQAEQLAKDRGYSYVRIDTNKCNPAMPTLITKAGYEFKGEISLAGKPETYRYLCYEKRIP